MTDPTGQLTVREACRRRMPLDGADAQCLEHALTITERERDEARADLARLGGPDPDADLWRRLQSLAGIELPREEPPIARVIVIGLLERAVQQLEDWQAGATGAATITCPVRVGPHTEEAYQAHRSTYMDESEEYRLGADTVAAAVQSIEKKETP